VAFSIKREGAETTETETTAAKALHITDQKAAYDEACKRLLSEKPILARLMKECLEEYKDCTVQEIAEKLIEGTPQISEVPVMPDEAGPLITGMDTQDKSLYEGTTTYDIRFYALVPEQKADRQKIVLIINVEAQGDFNPGYPLLMRAVFYCCRMISSQYGREFTNSHYEKIKKVCSIWICLDPPKYRRNTITRYRLIEEPMVGSASEPAGHYDLMTIIMICLGGPEETDERGILRMLNVLLTNNHSETEKRRILENEYDLPMTQAIEREVSQMCNLSSYVERRGIEKGILQGRAEGRKEGIEKGREEMRLSSLKNLMNNLGLSAEQAMNALDVPESDKQKYRNLLAQQQ